MFHPIATFKPLSCPSVPIFTFCPFCTGLRSAGGLRYLRAAGAVWGVGTSGVKVRAACCLEVVPGRVAPNVLLPACVAPAVLLPACVAPAVLLPGRVAPAVLMLSGVGMLADPIVCRFKAGWIFGWLRDEMLLRL